MIIMYTILKLSLSFTRKEAARCDSCSSTVVPPLITFRILFSFACVAVCDWILLLWGIRTVGFPQAQLSSSWLNRTPEAFPKDQACQLCNAWLVIAHFFHLRLKIYPLS